MKSEQVIMPKNLKLLTTLGENIRLARLRRKLTAEQVAERAGIGRKTLYSIELGSPSVSMGNYLQVLFVLGLQNDIVHVAANDTLGRKLQDAGMIINKRGAKRTL
ncbi:MAG: helix-turn-helix transcriptional regulator [Sphingobacteriales bacterium]|nr:helix-turn-helix transcriptional regulator [Sphingobacteriales bacterium]